MKRKWTLWVSAPLLVSGTALAQAGEANQAASAEVGAPASSGDGAGSGTLAVTPGTMFVPFGLPATGAANAESSAPSSGALTNTPVVRGNETGGVVLASSAPTTTPETYTVKRGDTLWSISDLHFSSAWAWPKVWSMNPEVQNPNWIYPGDQLRLRPGSKSAQAQGPRSTMTIGSGGVVLRKAEVPANTVFLRDRGYLDDTVKDIWGEIGGSPEEQMLLSTGNDVYLDIKKDQKVSVGDELTIFRPLRHVDGGDKGTVVAILGTARINRWDPKTRIARAQITEALDVIERGAKVGPVGRRFDVVPPQPSEVDVWAKITASLYPHVLYGQEQVVFIDKGEKDGLRPGNRLFVIARGDQWRRTLSMASEYAAARPEEEGTGIDKSGARGGGDDDSYPEEVIGEIRILRVREHTATCLVTSSAKELEPGFQIVARKGY